MNGLAIRMSQNLIQDVGKKRRYSTIFLRFGINFLFLEDRKGYVVHVLA